MAPVRTASLLLCLRLSTAHYGPPPCGPNEKLLKFMDGAICAPECVGLSACPAAPSASPGSARTSATAFCSTCGDGGGKEGFGGPACAGGGASCRSGTVSPRPSKDCSANETCESNDITVYKGAGHCLPDTCMLSCYEDDLGCPDGAVCSNPSGICIFVNSTTTEITQRAANKAQDHPAKPGPIYGQDCKDAWGEGYCCECGKSDVTGQCSGYPKELTCIWQPQHRSCGLLRWSRCRPS